MTSNQKNNIEKDNITSINLGDCEFKLKEEYGIPLTDSLFILKIDVNVKEIKIPKIEYEVYYPFNNDNLTKLDLSICKDIKIDISISIDLIENLEDLDKYNASSGFYNDIYYTYTNEKGTDETLKDIQNDYIENQMSVCEENCEFSNYNATLKKAICSCYVKVQLPLISEIKFDSLSLILILILNMSP